MIKTQKLRRSALYVPASNIRAIKKARSLDCDVIILDLEDAVAPSDKEESRQRMVGAVRDGAFAAAEVVVRINDLQTPWGQADMAAVRAAGPDAVLAPKVASAADIGAYAQALAGKSMLWAMVETCAAVMRLDEIAGSGELSALVFGSNDLLVDMRAAAMPARDPLMAALCLTVTAARAYGLTVLDGVYNALEDEAGLRAECRQGAAMGFDGKTLIHPAQIAVCHQIFAPSEAAVAQARAVVGAFAHPDNAGRGVLVVDGQMTERLHLDQALRILEIHDAASAAQSA